MNTHTGDIFVGIDVSKATLEVACAPTGEHWVVANDAPGIARLVARLVPLAPERIVLEATGGLEMPVVTALAAAKLAVVVVNPRQTRDFARATGTLAKSDRIDAERLAAFAQAVIALGKAQRILPGESPGREGGIERFPCKG
jgi:transposase